LDLDATVASYLPAFAAHGKEQVTVRQLLIHTSGLPAWLPLYTLPDNAARLAAVHDVVPLAPAGTAYLYSDLNLIVLGEIIELVAGAPLDAVLRRDIVAPLGLRDTGFNPPAAARPRIAATEYRAGVGVDWGVVHDENAAAFGGVAGHAGIFSTARDLAVLCQTVLNGGGYGRARILSQRSTELLLANFTPDFPGQDHGLGFELYRFSFMGAMASPQAAGHTGFTGTTLTIDRSTDSFLLVLTNRVHPSRDWGSINPRRRAVADEVARAVPVRPVRGRTAWFSGMGHARTATLTLPVTTPAVGARLDFALWYATEPSVDRIALESSADGGQTWAPLPFRLRSGSSTVDTDGTVSGWGGRRWQAATADLPGGAALLLRWRYQTDAALQGRGGYVDAVRVAAGHRVLFDERRPADAALLSADGFTASAD
jgi:CubicO group peptidase (beta-lactamase class C family)